MLLKRFQKNKLNFKFFVFELTPKCNHDCIYCYNVWKHGRYPEGEIDVDSWEKIVGKLKKETKFKTVALSGGEPLLNSKVFDILKILKKYRINTNLITNGSLMSKEFAIKFVKKNISIFEFSLVASNREDHKKIKGIDDFDKVIEGIVNVKKAGGRIITVFVATNKNIHLLKDTLDLSIFLGSDGIMFNRINPACKEHIELMPTDEQVKKALDYLEGFASKFKFPVSVSIPIQPCVINMNKYNNLSHGYCPSGNERSYYTVDFLGNVRICNHSPQILGNLLTDDFKKIVEHRYVEEFKKVLPEECSGCERLDECRGGCKASSEVCYDCLSRIDPFGEIYGERNF